jgi:hypothetical protein
MRRNVSPKVWGREGWTFLTSCAQACDEESFDKYVQFLELLPDVLPCEQCRYHARQYLLEHPPSKAPDLTQWVQDFERAVGQRKAPAGGDPPLPSATYLLVLLSLAFLLVFLLGLCLPLFLPRVQLPRCGLA